MWVMLKSKHGSSCCLNISFVLPPTTSTYTIKVVDIALLYCLEYDWHHPSMQCMSPHVMLDQFPFHPLFSPTTTTTSPLSLSLSWNHNCKPGFLCWNGATWEGGTCEVGGPASWVTERVHDHIASLFCSFFFFFLPSWLLHDLPQVCHKYCLPLLSSPQMPLAKHMLPPACFTEWRDSFKFTYKPHTPCLFCCKSTLYYFIT